MVTGLFLTVIRLSVTGSLGYVFLKLLAASGGNHLSQSWRYHGAETVSLLFLLPVYKLWAFLPVFHVSPMMAAGGGSETASLPVFSAGAFIPQSMPEAGVNWGLALEWSAALWLLVAAGLVLWNFWRLLRCRRLIEQAGSEVNSRLQQLALEEAHLAGIRGKVRLLASPLVQSPMLIGFFRAVILLPAEPIPEQDARLILAHELTHFRRRDLWKKQLNSILSCIHWFNPIIYLLNRDFARWLETSCDEHIVRSLDRDQRKKYGYLLIHYAPVSQNGVPKQYLSFASCQDKLKRRISTMLNSHKKTRTLLGRMLAAALAAGCLTATALAAANETDNGEHTAHIQSNGTVVTVDGTISNTVEYTDTLDAETTQVFSVDMLDGSEEQQVPVDDTIGDGGTTARGELAAHQGYRYGSIPIGAGKTLTVSVTGTPSDAALRIGYVDGSGMATYVDISSGSHTFSIGTTGIYSIYVFNTSDYTITYSASYLVA